MTTIDLSTARNLALNSQFPDNMSSIREIVEHLGYVQIDTKAGEIPKDDNDDH